MKFGYYEKYEGEHWFKPGLYVFRTKSVEALLISTVLKEVQVYKGERSVTLSLKIKDNQLGSNEDFLVQVTLIRDFQTNLCTV